MTPAGRRRHSVTVQHIGSSLPDGDGGYTEQWTDATPPRWFVEITPAAARDLEHWTAGTVISEATHIVRGPYRADVATTSRLVFNGRTLNVAAVSNPEERGIGLVVVCVEVVE